MFKILRSSSRACTLVLTTEAGIELNPFLFSKLPYNPVTDLTPITSLIDGPLVYVVKADSPYATISYGSSGKGTTIHLSVNWLGVQAGNVEFIHAPYRGSILSVQDVLGGNVHFTAAALAIVTPFITDGKLRALATTSNARLRTLPNVPTLNELGYKDSVSYFMLALSGPAKLPKAVASRIASDVRAVMREPDFQARHTEPFGYALFNDTPEEFAKFLASDREKQAARVKAANVRLD